MPIVTCAALALALANPASHGTYQLAEDCGPVTGFFGGTPRAALQVPVVFQRPLVVEAGDHKVHGLIVDKGGNLTWRGGQIVAPAGSQAGLRGKPVYGVLLANASKVTLEKLHLTNARKAIVVNDSSDITLRDARCNGDVEDCMIASGARRIRFLNNEIGPFQLVATRCLRGAVLSLGEGRRQCEAGGGQWTDGWHADVLQLRNGVEDVLAEGNRINTTGQGLTQMEAVGDLPIRAVVFRNNVIASGRHGLTLGACFACRIEGNRLTTAVPGWKSQIRPGQALACGNQVPDGGPGRDKCR